MNNNEPKMFELVHEKIFELFNVVIISLKSSHFETWKSLKNLNGHWPIHSIWLLGMQE